MQPSEEYALGLVGTGSDGRLDGFYAHHHGALAIAGVIQTTRLSP
ncbi:deoxyguanosinetriphosphate triphosphohydrolase-like protein [Vibrio alginolyticus 12G01]|nr:deoxyguanosinetriphosphate triphosphohydrolase-like protein [Vibrio alginolyticus 12G01]